MTPVIAITANLTLTVTGADWARWIDAHADCPVEYRRPTPPSFAAVWCPRHRMLYVRGVVLLFTDSAVVAESTGVTQDQQTVD